MLKIILNTLSFCGGLGSSILFSHWYTFNLINYTIHIIGTMFGLSLMIIPILLCIYLLSKIGE